MPDQTMHDLRGALAGQRMARDALFDRLRPRLVLWSASRMSPALRAKFEPEDVAQEILLAMHRSLDRFEGENERAFKAWLFTVAENRIRDLVDSANALKRQIPEPRTIVQTSPSMGAARNEMAQKLRAAILLLPDDYRRVIQLRRFEELDTEEVGARMDRTPNAVRILYFRAISALREEIDKFPEMPAGGSRLDDTV
ncbi:MAG: RNA polymerase sigma factor [Planctomycetota bacterium]